MDAPPQFDRFTGQARRAIWLAYQEAQRFDHDYLASEHLLAGLLREGSAEIAGVFREQNIPPDEVMEKIELVLGQADVGPDAASIFLTPRTRHALDEAVEISRQDHAPLAGVVHILRAMIADPEASTRDFLEGVGFDLERGQRWLQQAVVAPNRDLLIQSTTTAADGPRIDPTAAQLTQLLGGDGPRVDLATDIDPAVSPAIAEIDFQLFLTQLMLAITIGLGGGYVLFRSVDSMVAVAVVFALVACFRSSILGCVLGVTLGALIAQHLHNGQHMLDTPAELLLSVAFAGGLIGSFLGNFWRRFCPSYLHPSTTHQKPPGVV